MKWLLSPYGEARTYRVLSYLLVGLVLGVLDFTIVVTGLALGLGLMVTLLGVPVLVITFLVVRALAAMERRLAWSLLDAPMPRRRLPADEQSGLFWERFRSMAAASRTWSEVAFLILRLPMAALDFVFVSTLISAALGGIAQPILVASGVDTQIGSWTVDTLPEALALVPVSIVFLLVGARLIVGWGGLSRRMASRLLGRLDSADLKREVLEVLSRNPEVDGFRIFDELALRLGRGPFLTATRLEATLLALQSAGRVTVRHEGPSAVYTLT